MSSLTSLRNPLGLFLLLACWLLPAREAGACYAVIAGSAATADGSVLVGHNEQNGGHRLLNFRKVPEGRPEREEKQRLRRGGSLPATPSAALLWSENLGLEFSDGYLNQYGVAVVSDGCRSREDDYDTLVARGEIRDGGIGYMLRRLVAQRARSAREGVELAGRLVEQFGYVDSGRTYVIADPREAWLLAVVRGRRWAAQRVPDDAVVLLPNVYIIDRVDLAEGRQFLACPDLVDYAAARGWFDPRGSQAFRFWQAYGWLNAVRPDPRQWAGQQQALGHNDPWPPSEPLPLAVAPPKRLTVADVAAILRWSGKPVPISTSGTQEGAVFQLRSGLPPEIGCVYWRTTAEPAASVFTPWYVGIDETPGAYYRPQDVALQLTLEAHFDPPAEAYQPDPSLAWWTFKTLQDTVHENAAQRLPRVQPAWSALEQKLFAAQPQLEARAQSLWKTDPAACRQFLTRYCADVSAEALGQAGHLTEQLRQP